MAKRQKNILSLKNPIVRYGLYGIVGYYGYCFYKEGSVMLPIIGRIGAPLPEPTVSAFPELSAFLSRWLP